MPRRTEWTLSAYRDFALALKSGGGDRSSRPAKLQARENEQKALSLWIKGATFQQIAAAGFGIATASGAWRAVHRALAQIPKQEADQAREVR